MNSLHGIQALGLAASLLFAGMADASARGGGHGGPGPVIVRPAGHAGLHRAHSRAFNRRMARAYYPAAGFGFDWPAPGMDAPAPASEPVSRSDYLYTHSVIVHRGPAFGEPGYYSRARIYRIQQDGKGQAGGRRFRVERTDF